MSRRVREASKRCIQNQSKKHVEQRIKDGHCTKTGKYQRLDNEPSPGWILNQDRDGRYTKTKLDVEPRMGWTLSQVKDRHWTRSRTDVEPCQGWTLKQVKDGR